jgi:hypothetical protein
MIKCIKVDDLSGEIKFNQSLNCRNISDSNGTINYIKDEKISGEVNNMMIIYNDLNNDYNLTVYDSQSHDKYLLNQWL